jgi:hypothetical protein
MSDVPPAIAARVLSQSPAVDHGDFAAPAGEPLDTIAANKRDVPYQSLIKTWLAEKVDKA